MVLIGDRARAHFAATIRQPLIERRAHGMLLKSRVEGSAHLRWDIEQCECRD